MNVNNMTLSEKIRKAEAEDNWLALSIHDAMQAQSTEREEQLEELIADVVQDYADKVDEAVEAYNKDYYLNPESDYCDSLAEHLVHDIDANKLKDFILELTADNYYRNRCPLTDEELEYLEALDEAGRERLAEALVFMEGYKIEVNHGYGRVAYALAGTVIGEHEEELEHYLEDIPEVIRKQIVEKLTGKPDSTYIYIDNSYSSVDLVMDFNWLEEWVLNDKEEQAEAA
ncbi:hypothetical protein LH51_17585 [Nitrincola sp. A-D6]|uniref:hypothetical protein n=1 Tax=Nitrincola sp. A-D6 TaxID=1545442 RepID=UPI00051FE060|nr:hypothetical protein [Nitrincola sp. A-D6]KGK41044.1 hypothetical protein LH51_17585 [Nitrincola sp. A-D6]